LNKFNGILNRVAGNVLRTAAVFSMAVVRCYMLFISLFKA
jgi:hypothetical protein